MNYQILKTIVDTELKRFETISEEQWSYKASPEKWSRKEIIGHLCDSAFTNIRRFVVTQYKENENTVYDQDAWVKAQNYQNISTAEVINLWKALNYQIVYIVENMPDYALQRTSDVSKKATSEILTLETLIKEYIDHLHHHLETI
ncbi:DinB family protein [Elizabethkingia sp. YR214]|uniref:DinB family protein n=1 Tax=Elizabethkingia sp. YR214 TaxID=2135667 RepID=UPI000D31BED0|nr:DinB family protein [Elizabethkingia sp. YR214]PUB30686.1 DinB family protein [Elizabethkingia sp. YR214]